MFYKGFCRQEVILRGEEVNSVTMDNWSEGQKLDCEPHKWVLGHLVDNMVGMRLSAMIID